MQRSQASLLLDLNIATSDTTVWECYAVLKQCKGLKQYVYSYDKQYLLSFQEKKQEKNHCKDKNYWLYNQNQWVWWPANQLLATEISFEDSIFSF